MLTALRGQPWKDVRSVGSRVATNVEISTKRGKTKIFLTNVEKTWISVISMEKPWKFEIGVKEKTWIFQFLPIFPNFCNERGKKRGFRGISMEKSWKFETRVK